MNIDEKVLATAFELSTSKSFADVRELGALAADYSAGVMTKVHEADVTDSSVTYIVKRMGMMQVMEFSLKYSHESPSGSSLVSLVPGEYLTSRPTIFEFIPIGPSDCAGYPPLRSFSSFMKERLG